MAEITFRDACLIGDYKLPYIIAEINSSHNGSIETAKEMIIKAKECGCSCVKFQSWSAESLYSRSYYKDNSIAERIVKKFSMSGEELRGLARYCKEVGISFSSTPYSPKEVDELLECNAPYIKIASMDINNDSFLRYIGKTGAPVILSTGMAEIEEIRKAVNTIKKSGNKNLALLHCISIYPAEASTIHLNNILMLRHEFPECPIGFSDHTLGTEIASAATALGAAIIEKHFTLDKTKMGMDNNMAIEPVEMAQLVRNCRNVFEAMGSYERIVSPAEYEQRKKMRRSIIAVRSLMAGTVLTAEVLGAKRPGDGIPVDELNSVIGRRLKRDVEADTLIYHNDLN